MATNVSERLSTLRDVLDALDEQASAATTTTDFDPREDMGEALYLRRPAHGHRPNHRRHTRHDRRPMGHEHRGRHVRAVLVSLATVLQLIIVSKWADGHHC